MTRAVSPTRRVASTAQSAPSEAPSCSPFGKKKKYKDKYLAKHSASKRPAAAPGTHGARKAGRVPSAAPGPCPPGPAHGPHGRRVSVSAAFQTFPPERDPVQGLSSPAPGRRPRGLGLPVFLAC